MNALTHEVTFKMKENRDRSITITPDMLYRAQEQIIYRRDTHIDILIDKLKEPRVKRVIEPILSGSNYDLSDNLPTRDDFEYVEDLGVISCERGKPRRILGNIYQTVIKNVYS